MKQTENVRRHIGETLTIRWGTSRGRDTYGYTTCSLRNDRGDRVASCSGGGYDLRGTVIGEWIAKTFAKELLSLTADDMPIDRGERLLYGLRFYDPEHMRYDAGSHLPTDKHRVISIDGACGEDSMRRILRAIGLSLRKVADTSKLDVYVIEAA